MHSILKYIETLKVNILWTKTISLVIFDENAIISDSVIGCAWIALAIMYAHFINSTCQKH